MKRKILFSVSLKLLILIVVFNSIPCFGDEALGAKNSIQAQLVIFLHPEGGIEIALSTGIFRVGNVAVVCTWPIKTNEYGRQHARHNSHSMAAPHCKSKYSCDIFHFHCSICRF